MEKKEKRGKKRRSTMSETKEDEGYEKEKQRRKNTKERISG